jgi:hypothetical protein
MNSTKHKITFGNIKTLTGASSLLKSVTLYTSLGFIVFLFAVAV